MNRITDILRVVLTPSCWMQNGPYSAGWDMKLRRLMANGKFTPNDKFTVYIGGVQVWIANHPYASFTPCFSEARPSRITILNAWKKLDQEMHA